MGCFWRYGDSKNRLDIASIHKQIIVVRQKSKDSLQNVETLC